MGERLIEQPRSTANQRADPLLQTTQHRLHNGFEKAQQSVGSRLNPAARMVGNTPLIRIDSLSNRTGCNILAKAEFMNPGGSIKDRAALRMILDLEERKLLIRGQPGNIIEASSGNTGSALAMFGAAFGYKVTITLPEDLAQEKITLISTLGAEIVKCKHVGWDDPEHCYNVAKRLAKERPGSVFTNQFHNGSNFACHYDTTAVEIGRQIKEHGLDTVDAFICAAGTSGTISGVSRRLKAESKGQTLSFHSDVQGSALYSYLSTGGRSTAHVGRTVIEGVGNETIKGNAIKGLGAIDGAMRVSDREAIAMCHFILKEDGLFIGSSSGINLTAAVKLARVLGPNSTIVTVIPDSGERYRSKVYSKDFLKEHGLEGADEYEVRDAAQPEELSEQMLKHWDAVRSTSVTRFENGLYGILHHEDDVSSCSSEGDNGVCEPAEALNILVTNDTTTLTTTDSKPPTDGLLFVL